MFIGILRRLGYLCINSSLLFSLFVGDTAYYNDGVLTPAVVYGRGGYPILGALSGESSTLLIESTYLRLSLLLDNETFIYSNF